MDSRVKQMAKGFEAAPEEEERPRPTGRKWAYKERQASRGSDAQSGEQSDSQSRASGPATGAEPAQNMHTEAAQESIDEAVQAVKEVDEEKAAAASSGSGQMSPDITQEPVPADRDTKAPTPNTDLESLKCMGKDGLEEPAVEKRAVAETADVEEKEAPEKAEEKTMAWVETEKGASSEPKEKAAAARPIKTEDTPDEKNAETLKKGPQVEKVHVDERKESIVSAEILSARKASDETQSDVMQETIRSTRVGSESEERTPAASKPVSKPASKVKVALPNFDPTKMLPTALSAASNASSSGPRRLTADSAPSTKQRVDPTEQLMSRPVMRRQQRRRPAPKKVDALALDSVDPAAAPKPAKKRLSWKKASSREAPELPLAALKLGKVEVSSREQQATLEVHRKELGLFAEQVTSVDCDTKGFILGTSSGQLISLDRDGRRIGGGSGGDSNAAVRCIHYSSDYELMAVLLSDAKIRVMQKNKCIKEVASDAGDMVCAVGPRFAKKLHVLVGGEGAPRILHKWKRTWLRGNKDGGLMTKPIGDWAGSWCSQVAWGSTYMAWASDKGVILYDEEESEVVVNVSIGGNKAYPCTLQWITDTALLAAWGSSVQIVTIGTSPKNRYIRVVEVTCKLDMADRTVLGACSIQGKYLVVLSTACSGPVVPLLQLFLVDGTPLDEKPLPDYDMIPEKSDFDTLAVRLHGSAHSDVRGTCSICVSCPTDFWTIRLHFP